MPPKKRTLALNQPQTVDEWLQAKVEFPGSYTISPEGLLIAPPSKSGDTERQIILTPRIPATKAHIEAEFVARTQQIKEAEEQFTEARRNLHRVIIAFKNGVSSAGEVVQANQQVKEAESFLSEKAVGPRYVRHIKPSPEIRDILLENRYADTKMSGSVYMLERASFPWNFMYEPRQEFIKEAVSPVAAAPPQAVKAEEEPKVADASQAKVGAIIAARKKKLKLPQA